MNQYQMLKAITLLKTDLPLYLYKQREAKVIFIVKCVSVYQINFYKAIDTIKENFKLWNIWIWRYRCEYICSYLISFYQGKNVP